MKRTTILVSAIALVGGCCLLYSGINSSSLSNQEVAFDFNELAVADTARIGTVTSVSLEDQITNLTSECEKSDVPPSSWTSLIRCQGDLPGEVRVVKVADDDVANNIQLIDEGVDSFLLKLDGLSEAEQGPQGSITLQATDAGTPNNIVLNRKKIGSLYELNVSIKEVFAEMNAVKTIYTLTSEVPLDGDETILISKNSADEIVITRPGKELSTGYVYPGDRNVKATLSAVGAGFRYSQ